MPLKDLGALRRLRPVEFRSRIVRACDGKTLEKAANSLGISVRSLQYYLRSLGIRRYTKALAKRK